MRKAEARKAKKLQQRYFLLAVVAGPDLLQEFMEEALRCVEKTAPDFAERLLRELRAHGVFEGTDVSQEVTFSYQSAR